MRRLILLSLLVLLIAAQSAHADEGEWSDHGRADFNDDCEVNVLDEQSIAYRYATCPGDLLYDPLYDVVPRPGLWCEAEINIADLQFVFGRHGFRCIDWWDPETSMGTYSLAAGSETVCKSAAQFYPNIGSGNYVDPISVVFYENASASRLEQEARAHGLPSVEHDGEQRFWEIKQCTFEDVDARGDRGWTCAPTDSCESWHFRAEVGAEGYATQSGPIGGHVDWGTFAVATPHFDDDCWPWGHFVPQVFPYPEELYPGFSGSGFDAGREWIKIQFNPSYMVVEYWGNRQSIRQGGCAQDQWPRSNGWAYFIPIEGG